MSTSDDYEIMSVGVSATGQEMFVVVRKQTRELVLDNLGPRDWAEDVLFNAGDQWTTEQREMVKEAFRADKERWRIFDPAFLRGELGVKPAEPSPPLSPEPGDEG